MANRGAVITVVRHFFTVITGVQAIQALAVWPVAHRRQMPKDQHTHIWNSYT